MRDTIAETIAGVCRELFATDVAVELTRPEEQFGDYATNVALQLAQQVGQNPREIAEALAVKLRERLGKQVSEVSVAGPGFINLKLNDQALLAALETKPAQTLKGQIVVAEYSDPSSFKVLHAGHLYTSVVGDAIANLLETAGGVVHRVNFGGDVGLHVAKTMWAILHELGAEQPEKLAEIADDQRPDWMSARYVEGNTAYENDEQVKAQIVALNKQIYQLHERSDHDSPFAQIYWTCRQWSYDYFDQFYARIGSHFEKYYPESVTMPLGLQTVREQLATGVYEQSDGAVVFRGEKYGLHTRVFINSQGLPTYEAKDVGLIMKKWGDYHFDLSFILTDNAQAEYMTVVLKSIEQFAPKLAKATRHHTHGRVKLAGGMKMSSREGNIVRAVDVLDIAAKANMEATGQDNAETALAAVKYAFLKQRLGGDVIYDPVESVSLQGNSGPYLQYAHARARSILRKLEGDTGDKSATGSDLATQGLEAGERSLVRKMGEYTETVDKAVVELLPHHICTYLYELAQTFNRFYEHHRVIGDPREQVRLTLVQRYAETLQAGLGLLGIAAPEQM